MLLGSNLYSYNYIYSPHCAGCSMDRCPVWQNYIVKKLREGRRGSTIALLLQVRTEAQFLPHQDQNEHLCHIKETNLRITSLRHFFLWGIADTHEMGFLGNLTSFFPSSKASRCYILLELYITFS